jgi:Domain of unknown function (DUF4432)
VTQTLVDLRNVRFTSSETVLLRHHGLTASVFRYASGVDAIRVRNEVGEIIWLPFQGQQIWDAHFHGRRLTMRSMFDDPVDTSDYLGNCGGFLLHCGVLAMGNPGPEDNHPLHGELPNAIYQEASIALGKDQSGAYLDLCGKRRHTIAFAANYEAEPRIRIHAGSGQLDAQMTVTNLKRSPMELMYLAHVNFLPVDGATLIDTASDEPNDVSVRVILPPFFVPSQAHTDFINAVQINPSLHRHMVPGRAIDPEIVMAMRFKPDASGWAHSMQLLPDGSADFISHRLADLPRGIRWITRTADQDALGLYLPGTAGADGYTAEAAKGNAISLEPGGTFHCIFRCGALTPMEAETMRSYMRNE